MEQMTRITEVHIKIVFTVSVKVDAKNESEAMEKSQVILMNKTLRKLNSEGIHITGNIELAPQSFT